MRINPASVAFTLLLGLLAVLPPFGIDMILPALSRDRRQPWRRPLENRSGP